ncbi:MAG: lipoyl(octanoyl) transferase LipB [Candidatus Heimdallarchaeota archaeon]|jgi:lipoate-protein ligase B|nr:lipoyl(octanoyl) transferase LipB [Candidatus Heimdallarchaeota archaeon]MCK4253318.1 lipoyl(octanoyl) transferase LipB [Candidatus Heimdallarchaeota archaeon]
MRNCFLVEYKSLEYRKSLDLQKQLRERKESNRDFDDFLLVLQHNHVFTIGRKGSKEDILAPENLLKEEGIDVVNVKRGGEVTYHGPGQLIGYLHLNLSRANLSVDQFVWNMEEVLIQLLDIYGIKGWRLEGYPGVWINHQARKWKIASIGARASKMISSHGLALNVNTDMEHFQMIVPCGITKFSPISMKQVLEKTLSITEIYNKFEQSFEKIFKMKLVKIASDKLEEMIK